MKAIIIKNGNSEVKIVLKPESDMEKSALNELGTDCTVNKITDNLKVFDENVSDGIILQAVTK
jgi:hypothetical protein